MENTLAGRKEGFDKVTHVTNRGRIGRDDPCLVKV